ncbi:hypothetical protein BHE74_00026633 [Ensete ventricosum]|nr:hypothetical protein BHE74_00026633 [Ensete ventricosum]
MLSERNFALRNKVLKLKSGMGSNAMATTEKWVTNLEVEMKRLRAKVECLKAALGDTEQCCQALRDVEALQIEVQLAVAKAIPEYKVSWGFEFDMERTGRVTYEFECRVALERFWVKYPNLSVEEDLFTNCLKDANV